MLLPVLFSEFLIDVVYLLKSMLLPMFVSLWVSDRCSTFIKIFLCFLCFFSPQLAVLICYLHLSLTQTSVAISQLVFFINMFPHSSGLLALREAAHRRLSPRILPQDFDQLSVASWIDYAPHLLGNIVQYDCYIKGWCIIFN